MEDATAKLPVIVSEFGADARTRTVPAGITPEVWVRRVLQALDDHHWHWASWDLHTSASPCLISDCNYSPTPGFGTWVKQALAGTLPPYPPPQPWTQNDPASIDGLRHG